MKNNTSVRRKAGADSNGFSLIEVMVALVLGLLVSIGLIAVFNTTGKMNRVQEAMARLQENGRFATTRIAEHVRSAGGQYCNGTAGYSKKTTANGPVFSVRAPLVFSQLLPADKFADSGGTIPAPPAGWQPVGSRYPLSPRYFIQGYDCGASSCTPAVPAGSGRDGLPSTGTTDGSRVPGADVLTVRFQAGTGWNATCLSSVNPPVTPVVTARPKPGDDPMNFQTGDLALYTDCSTAQIMKVNVAGNVLAADPSSLLSMTNTCPEGGGGEAGDTRVFNFSRDFRTVTYYLGLKADTNPDAPADRVISSLYRRINGGAAEELVEGVERLDFLYGFEQTDGSVRLLTAAEVEAAPASACTPPPPDLEKVTVEPGCLWRSVASVEVHMLVNSVRDQFDLSGADIAYRYTISDPWFGTAPTAPATTTTLMPVTGLKAGRMMRREFITTISVRNFNL